MLQSKLSSFISSSSTFMNPNYIILVYRPNGVNETKSVRFRIYQFFEGQIKIIMDISSQYASLNRIDSFHQYHVPKAYEHTRKQSTKKPHRFKSKKSIFEDIQEFSKQVPGVGKYKVDHEKQPPKKNNKKVDFAKLQKQGKHTYLNDEIKRKKGIPAVGVYETERDLTEQIRKKYKQKNDEVRKKAPLFRPTILDQANPDNVKIGPADYETSRPMGYKSTQSTINPPHKRSISLPKLPSAVDYDPIPVSYQTFSRKQSVGSLTSKKDNSFGNRPKLSPQTLGPGPKYSLISTWVPQREKNGSKKGINYIQKTTSMHAPSIYH